MKTLLLISFYTLLSSCYTRDSNTEKLIQRITVLEQRVDSLTNGGNFNPHNTNPIYFSWLSDQCKAITKRGKACKRKGKYKGYCWQHRG